MPEPLRILLVDDCGPSREARRVLLASCANFAVGGEAVDGHSAIATRRIKRVYPSIHIIGISSQDDTITKEAMKAVGSSVFITRR